MKCVTCGRSDLTLVTCIDASTMKMKRICPVCIQKGHPGEEKRQPTLKELDERIAEYEAIALKAEEIIKEYPEMPELPPALAHLAKIAFTPMSHYKALQAVLAELKSQRMETLTNMESSARLQYELKKSLAAENYKQSAIIRDKIAQLKTE
jgi:hypothetical protein